ncbi:MAG: tRNA pseudouridine synthase A, partial [Actinobacteria bacterium]|nr:tRNA pseudouridine synthase A [Actinomycetota bacterium]
SGEIEKSLIKIFGSPVKVYGSARTDAGAHAICHPIAFEVPEHFQIQKIVPALNAWLPEDIRAIEYRVVESGFLPLKEAIARTYVYLIAKKRSVSLFFKNRAVYLGYDLDKSHIETLSRIISVFEGTHDFSAFMKAGSSTRTTIRTIFRMGLEENDNLVGITITANGFLYGQIRNMVAAMLAVAKGDLELSKLIESLETGKRIFQIQTAPAYGLYLYKVWFRDKNLNFSPSFPFLSIDLAEEKDIYATR